MIVVEADQQKCRGKDSVFADREFLFGTPYHWWSRHLSQSRDLTSFYLCSDTCEKTVHWHSPVMDRTRGKVFLISFERLKQLRMRVEQDGFIRVRVNRADQS